MRVRVRLLGVFRRFLPRGHRAGVVELEFAKEAVPLHTVRERIGIPPGDPRIVFRKGLPIEEEDELMDGDEVTFVSPIAGG